MPDDSVNPAPEAVLTPAVPSQGIGLIRFMLARMAQDEITRVAASLSFTSTLAVVPALSLVLAILTAFPAFEGMRASVQDFILGNVMPDTGLKMKEQIASFVDAAARLTAFGIVGLAVTSIALLLTIESSFNEIFKVHRPRPLLTRLLVLWAMITVGPFLIGLSFTLFGYFAATQFWMGKAAAKSLTLLLGQIAPTILAWVAITFMYLVVPNRRVMLTDAMLGAAFAAILFGLLRYSFAAYIASMTSYEAVYGAVAAVPVFLVWVLLTWTVVMAGAVVAAALPDWRYAKAGGGDAAVARIVLALEVIAKLATAQNTGAAISSRALAKTLSVPDVVLGRVLDSLRLGRFVAVTDDGKWVLSRDLDRIALADVVHQFGLGLDLAAVLAMKPDRPSEVARRLHQNLSRAAESERALLSITLAKIVALPESAPELATAPEPSA
ncbi:MAG: YihY family inner membrane protein [Rhodospirillaceae bacterium]|nr:YihY family inner membrane protein [Rhodospirillaceae bacterium]